MIVNHIFFMHFFLLIIRSSKSGVCFTLGAQLGLDGPALVPRENADFVHSPRSVFFLSTREGLIPVLRRIPRFLTGDFHVFHSRADNRWQGFIQSNIPEADLRGGRCAWWKMGGGVWVLKEVLDNSNLELRVPPPPDCARFFEKGNSCRGKEPLSTRVPSISYSVASHPLPLSVYVVTSRSPKSRGYDLPSLGQHGGCPAPGGRLMLSSTAVTSHTYPMST